MLLLSSNNNSVRINLMQPNKLKIDENEQIMITFFPCCTAQFKVQMYGFCGRSHLIHYVDHIYS